VLGLGVERESEVVLPAGALYQRVDLTRPREVRRVLFGPVRELGLEAVAHLAFHRDVDARGGAAHRLHVESVRLLLRVAEAHPTIARFVLLSTARVYKLRTDIADVLREDAPLDLSPSAPQWVRDRVEADVTATASMGLCPRLSIAVLRVAEILAPRMGSQLEAWLRSPVCLRAAGFDPMIDVLSLEDAAVALERALACPAEGVFNVPGADVLPLSRVGRLWGRTVVPVPGPLLGPIYGARRIVAGDPFRYGMNRGRLHFNGVLDGTRAREVMGYVPAHPVRWPADDRAPSPGSGPRSPGSARP
jgi:UDP-glucose 4-epimerase